MMQRFVLAVFYYATGGGLKGKWARHSGFLTPGVHECQWNEHVNISVLESQDIFYNQASSTVFRDDLSSFARCKM